MKRFLTSLVLGSALSVSVLAGEIPTVPGPQPQSQPNTNPTVLGEIPSVPLSEAALSALLTAIGIATI